MMSNGILIIATGNQEDNYGEITAIVGVSFILFESKLNAGGIISIFLDVDKSNAGENPLLSRASEL